MAESVKGILLRTEHLRGLQLLDPRQVGELVFALFADAGEGDMPELDDMTRVVFELVAPSVRRANDAYATRCETNAENARKGGRPRKKDDNRETQSETEETEPNTQKPMAFSSETQKPMGFSEKTQKPIRNEIERERELINTPHSLLRESTPQGGAPAPVRDKQKSVSVSRKPPTPEEVQAYCDERGNGLNAERFCDYYAAQGWKLSNGQPLRDWKAAVRTWESREKDRQVQAQHVPRASTVAQQRQQERQLQARMLLADREQRRHAEEKNAQGQRYVTNPDGSKLALPPGW